VAWKAGRLVKLGGIIGEQMGGRLLLGLGVNLTEAPAIPGRAIPPASLKQLGIQSHTAPELAIDITNIWNNLAHELQPHFRWPESGMPLCWEDGQGVCLGWETDGRLKVATAEGVRRLNSGEINGLA
jgi:biotin-(acetyl-CoA carboxylase) ligase